MKISSIILSAFFLTVSCWSFQELDALLETRDSTYAKEREVLYLPSGKGLRFISFGYENFLADILWFNTISYFGKHYDGDKNYQWLGHMCELVTSLDPQALHVYKFCNTMLSWEAGKPKQAAQLLTKALKHHPNVWELWSLRGFTYLFFLNDQARASSDMIHAASLPGAPVLIQRLAAKKMLSSSPETAIAFLQNMLQQAEDESERKALQDRLDESIFELVAQKLEKAIEVYTARLESRPESIEDLRQSGIISIENLKDPFGGEYMIDPETGKIVSSTGRKRMKMFEASTSTSIQQKWDSTIDSNLEEGA